jgi:hypothetical protein
MAACVDWRRAHDENDLNFKLIRLEWRTFTVEFNPKEVLIYYKKVIVFFLREHIGKLFLSFMLIPHVFFIAYFDASNTSGGYH